MTAVEDKLQENVGQTIRDLLLASSQNFYLAETKKTLKSGCSQEIRSKQLRILGGVAI